MLHRHRRRSWNTDLHRTLTMIYVGSIRWANIDSAGRISESDGTGPAADMVARPLPRGEVTRVIGSPPWLAVCAPWRRAPLRRPFPGVMYPGPRSGGNSGRSGRRVTRGGGVAFALMDALSTLCAGLSPGGSKGSPLFPLSPSLLPSLLPSPSVLCTWTASACSRNRRRRVRTGLVVVLSCCC